MVESKDFGGKIWLAFVDRWKQVIRRSVWLMSIALKQFFSPRLFSLVKELSMISKYASSEQIAACENKRPGSKREREKLIYIFVYHLYQAWAKRTIISREWKVSFSTIAVYYYEGKLVEINAWVHSNESNDNNNNNDILLLYFPGINNNNNNNSN